MANFKFFYYCLYITLGMWFIYN
ncbi:MAG TPA: hypothetical protein DEZ08_07520 [Dehalococcoidia bacterium]|nr:hypothetical protein [Dehalococcoidia bacterium]